MISRRLGTAIAVIALTLSGLSAAPATAGPVGTPETTGDEGCSDGLYWAGGTTGYQAWSECFLPGGHDFYSFARCREGYQRTSKEYPTTGKHRAWTVGGCPTKPRDYGHHLVN